MLHGTTGPGSPSAIRIVTVDEGFHAHLLSATLGRTPSESETTMSEPRFVIALPIADRPRSHEFYREVLGLEAFGEPADDGVPEPLQFTLASGVDLMLVPTGGFQWAIGGQPVTPDDQHETVITVAAASPTDVDELVDRARRAGARVVVEPGDQSWGYTATFADPDGHLWAALVPPANA